MNFRIASICIFSITLLKTVMPSPVEVRCTTCPQTKSCATSKCLIFNGEGFNDYTVCHNQTSCSNDYPLFYFPIQCKYDSGEASCDSGCCVRNSPTASATRTCTSTMLQPSYYCSTQLNNGYIAIIIGGSIGGLICLIITICCALRIITNIRNHYIQQQIDKQAAKNEIYSKKVNYDTKSSSNNSLNEPNNPQNGLIESSSNMATKHVKTLN